MARNPIRDPNDRVDPGSYNQYDPRFYGSLGYTPTDPDSRAYANDVTSDLVQRPDGSLFQRIGDPSVLQEKTPNLLGGVIDDPVYGNLLSLADWKQHANAYPVDDSDSLKMFALGAGALGGLPLGAAVSSVGLTGSLADLGAAAGTGASAFPAAAEGAALGGEAAPWGYPQSWNMLAGDAPSGGMVGATGGDPYTGLGYSAEDIAQLEAGTYSGAEQTIGQSAGQLGSLADLTTMGGSGSAALEAARAAVAKAGPSAASSLTKLLSGDASAGDYARLAGILGTTALGALAANKASNAQAASGQAAIDELRRQYDTNRADLAPWRTAGAGAVTRLSDLTTPGHQVTAMEMDPGYDWRFSEGQRAVDRSAAARGRLQSGAALKAATRYGQNFATNEFGNIFNRDSTLAGLGSTATNAGVAAGSNTSGQIAQNITGIGNARASGYVGGANAVNSGATAFLSQMSQQDLIDALLRR